jgi:signal transduction histidine kinase/ActR/RegA family two-component response regulator
MKIKNVFLRVKYVYAAIWIEIVCLIVFAALSIYFLNSQRIAFDHYNDTQNLRYNSYLLADQLRHSSDDLTRMVRTYVATGDKRFEDYFRTILDIREGRKPRPLNSERAYWDFLTLKNPEGASPEGKPVSLVALMQKAGFTEEEMALLNEAKTRSDKLVSLEEKAFHAMKGEFTDGRGGFTVKGEPDQKQALSIVFGEEYHRAKMNIMKPINDFFRIIDQRTMKNVQAAMEKAGMYRTAMAVFFCLMILDGMFLYFSVGLHRRLELAARSGSEKKYRESEAKLIEAQKIARLGNWENNFLTNTLTWSDEIYRIFEIDPAEFGASYEAFLEMVHPDDRDTLNKAYMDSVEKKTKYAVDHRLLMKDGRIKFVHEQGRTYYDEKGKPVRSIGVVQDITDQWQMENEKKKLETQLRRSQKMEAIGTLAGGIAHDFNNILFPIIGYAEMLYEDLPQDSPHRIMVNHIYNGGIRAKELVKQLLAFSRETEQELKPLKVHLVVNETCALLKASLPSTIETKLSLDKNCGMVMADPTQMHQITMNLITNAFHAMEDTGGRLAIELKELDLSEEDLKDPSMKPGRYACLSISDTGKGIHPIHMERIFDPYFTTKEQGKGTGLGLSIVHSIVKIYKGDIRVYSELGKGTVFRVFLPVIESVENMESILEPLEQLKGTERILIVDDEPEILQTEKKMLERLGYHVTEKANSQDALDTFRKDPGRFDIVISDMTMPRMTGDTLARKILEIKPGIPIIICSGFSNRMNEEKAREMGLRGFIMKPIIKREVARAIRKALDPSLPPASLI